MSKRSTDASTKGRPARLDASATYGIWAGVTMAWNEDYSFDTDTYAKNVERMIAANVHGIYTTGSTGEFYALKYDEFCCMVDIEAEHCGRAGMKLQIGCCSDATAKTVRMLEYVAGKPAVGAAQIALPYWMELTDREVVQFYKDLYTACPDMPLVSYNVPRTKRFLHGDDYLRILEVAPSLIGVKYTMAGSNFGALQTDILKTPQLSYFVGENMLVSGMQLGTQGCYSSLVCTDPAYALEMYDHAAAGRWDKAYPMQQHVSTFFDDVEAFMEQHGQGGMDPVCDKGLGVASGCLLGHQRCRPPYIGWTDEFVIALRTWLEQRYPEFVYPHPNE